MNLQVEIKNESLLALNEFIKDHKLELSPDEAGALVRMLLGIGAKTVTNSPEIRELLLAAIEEIQNRDSK